jgi:hypothetical protein
MYTSLLLSTLIPPPSNITLADLINETLVGLPASGPFTNSIDELIPTSLSFVKLFHKP